MEPPFDSCDDAFGGGCPDEGLWVVIMFCQEAVDGVFEVRDGMEDSAFETTLGEGSEKALNRIEPGARCRSEVEGESSMPGKPSHDVGMSMGGIVIKNDVGGLARRYCGVDVVEKAEEPLP